MLVWWGSLTGQDTWYSVQDPCTKVRRTFALKLHRGLYNQQLSLQYLSLLSLAADDPDASQRKLVKEILTMIIRLQHKSINDRMAANCEFLYSTSTVYQKIPFFWLIIVFEVLSNVVFWRPFLVDRVDRLRVILPENVLAYVVHLLAHSPRLPAKKSDQRSYIEK